MVELRYEPWIPTLRAMISWSRDAAEESLSTLRCRERGPRLLAAFVWDEGVGLLASPTAPGWSWKGRRDCLVLQLQPGDLQSPEF